MLKVQESMLFDSVVISLMARADGVVESINSLKASLKFSKKDIEDFIEACERVRISWIS